MLIYEKDDFAHELLPILQSINKYYTQLVAYDYG